ncbi:spore germination protein GerKB [Gracilibacillus boraciitolerans JCM 21714]|uniref:Spore germination protein GerKB n=1 Tax=Gracilibacillus boraciitolerans JCM 21714 TaxID=1298598 RepID=W4VQY2_9BACI|nr:endospore germination permease [Gracilibacillus boraciitolerans]GAE95379.1 spore germination protein GerKB [Gracilibacillus boraciitolerans JCM 21714]
MMQNSGFLRTKEIIAITLILVGIKLSDSTPALLAQKAQNGFWLIPILSFICIFPSFLIMLYLLKKYNDKNLVELMEAITGKWIGKSIGLLLFLFAFFTTTLDSRNYIEQVKLLYFPPQSPTMVIFFVFIGVVFFGAKKGIEVIGFTSWISLAFIKASALLVVVLALGDLVIQRIFPIFGSGLPNILTEGVKKASMFAELFFLLIAYKATKATSMFVKGIIIASIITLFEITLFYFIYISIFDYNSVNKIAFPFQDLTQFIELGQFFTNIETMFMVFWLLAAFIKFIILIYLTTWIFGEIFAIRNFEPLLLPFSFLVIMIGLLPFNAVINELILRESLLTIMSPFFIILPYLLWGGTAWGKGDLK